MLWWHPKEKAAAVTSELFPQINISVINCTRAHTGIFHYFHFMLLFEV